MGATGLCRIRCGLVRVGLTRLRPDGAAVVMLWVTGIVLLIFSPLRAPDPAPGATGGPGSRHIHHILLRRGCRRRAGHAGLGECALAAIRLAGLGPACQQRGVRTYWPWPRYLGMFLFPARLISAAHSTLAAAGPALSWLVIATAGLRRKCKSCWQSLPRRSAAVLGDLVTAARSRWRRCARAGLAIGR